jgi:hypothetical protein
LVVFLLLHVLVHVAVCEVDPVAAEKSEAEHDDGEANHGNEDGYDQGNLLAAAMGSLLMSREDCWAASARTLTTQSV